MAAPLGNQNAAKSKVVHDALRKIAVQEDYRRLNVGLGKVMDAFEAGEPWAAQFVRDTLDGKPAQSVEVGGPGDGGAVLIETIRRVIVDPKP